MGINDVLLDLINENKINGEQTLVLLKEIFYYKDRPHPDAVDAHEARWSRNINDNVLSYNMNDVIGTTQLHNNSVAEQVVTDAGPVLVGGGIMDQINNYILQNSFN